MTVKMTKKQYDNKPEAYKGIGEGQPAILTNQNGATVIDTVEFI